MVIELEKLRGRRVLITGHTGFKGKWLCSILLEYDVEIAGISREDELKDDFIKNFRSSSIKNYWVDLIDYLSVADIVKEFQPEFCFHMAAQPLVNMRMKTLLRHINQMLWELKVYLKLLNYLMIYNVQ